MTNAPSILIVEDCQDLLLALELAFKDAGFTTFIADCGIGGIAQFTLTPTQFVLTDLQMPNGTGFELIDGLRGFDERPFVVIMTGNSDFESEDALRAGAHALLKKPFRGIEAITTIRSFLDQAMTIDPASS